MTRWGFPSRTPTSPRGAAHALQPLVLSVNPMGEAIFASPAIASERLYIRTVSHLYAIGR